MTSNTLSALPPLEPGDALLAHVRYHPDRKAEPFEIAITHRVVILLRKKLFAVSNPYYFETTSLSDVLRLELTRLRAAWWYVLAAVMLVVGTYTTWISFAEGSRDEVWAIGVLVGGLILPFAARGRYALVLVFRSSSFVWKPRMVVGGTARRKQMEILSGLAEAARSAGVMVRDERGVI